MKKLKYIENAKVIERDEPINPKALEEIRDILKGVKSGRLLHNQQNYHTQTECGTAHCIAGWKAHNDAIKARLDFTYRTHALHVDSLVSDELEHFMYDKATTTTEWHYASSQWDLKFLESVILFDDNATLDQQFELLEVLESGCTIIKKR